MIVLLKLRINNNLSEILHTHSHIYIICVTNVWRILALLGDCVMLSIHILDKVMKYLTSGLLKVNIEFDHNPLAIIDKAKVLWEKE